jgi:hypothetical protein
MLNDICKKEFKQDYQHALGGDYDVNVLMEVLKIYGKECKWVGNWHQLLNLQL